MKRILARIATTAMFAMLLGIAGQPCHAQSDPYAPIESILQKEGYVPHFPLSDTIHPGGLAKLCGRSKVYDFIPLAQGAKIADTSPALFQWAAASSDKKTSLSVLLNAIGSFLSGINITATGSGEQTLNLNQISATGIILKFDPVSILQNDQALRQEVRNYQANCQIFLVTEVATTNAISFTTDEAIGASIHVNDTTTNSSCTLPPAPATTAGTAPATGTTPAAGTTPATGTTPAAGTASVSPATSTTLSAHLDACLTRANQITLNSPNALVFAVKLEGLNKMPPEPTVADATPAPVLISGKDAPVNGMRITGSTNPTSTQNILNFQVRQANMGALVLGNN